MIKIILKSATDFKYLSQFIIKQSILYDFCYNFEKNPPDSAHHPLTP